MKIAIVNVNLQIPCPNCKTNEEVENFAENYELPKEYVEDSYELVKVVEE